MTIIQSQTTKFPFLVENLTSFICRDLNIKPKSITISEYENEDHVVGLCIDEEDDHFQILIKEKGRDVAQICITLAHELIHVKQYMRENLGWYLDNHSHIPYIERWWEKEAYSNSVPLVEKFAKTIEKIHKKT
jgi:hypothetical protein